MQTKQTNNVWISAAVVSAAALLLLALAFASGGATPAPAAPTAAPAAVPQSNAPAAPVAPLAPAAPAAPGVAGEEVVLPSGLRYIDRIVGSGPSPNPGGSVVVHYDGFLEDGAKFDSSRDRGQPAQFSLNQVIPGFSEGLKTMKVGGKRTLFIPSKLGYGAAGSPPVIPANANLRFELELVAVK